MTTTLKLIGREFKHFWKNNVLRLLFIGAPIMYGVLVGSVYQKGKVTDLPVIVVDADRSPMSQRVIQMFEDNEVLKVVRVLNSTIGSREIALEKEAACVIVIPENFQNGILTKRYPEVTIFVDASNTLTANYASSSVNLCLATMKAGIQIETLKKQGMPQKIAETQYEPFRTTYIKENIRSGNYLYFMLPGVLLTVFQQVLLLGLALSFSSEFENGTFGSLVKRVKNPAHLIMIKTAPYFIMSFFILALYYGFGLYYQLPLNAGFFGFALSTLLFILSVCFLGILGSILFDTQLKATELLMVVATPSFILSGFTWPLSQMPGWVQAIANMIPLTHYLKIYRELFVEHGDLSKITDQLQALFIIGAVCFVASLYFLGRKIKKLEAVAE